MQETERLDRIERALEELTGHVRNLQTDADDQEQAFTLIQGGFQGNIDAQRDMASDIATLKERSMSLLVLSAVPVVALLFFGLLALAPKVLAWLNLSPAALAILGLR